eukprot:TRINITY_DN2156_c0_g1_i1.p1 TRINITY_DN2156_c0_g1~~TRINITY_DN2156_c0_g1_i1.p1  ORF type:complete len:566 (-),score=177.51 TRINITY_DN2156_c0_g1_i1:293-1990(-)
MAESKDELKLQGVNFLAAAFAAQKEAEQSTPCDNCDVSTGVFAVAFCSNCVGFFCDSCDRTIHTSLIFSRHERNYDRKSFATLATSLQGTTPGGSGPADMAAVSAGLSSSSSSSRTRSSASSRMASLKAARPRSAQGSRAGSGTATPTGAGRPVPKNGCAEHALVYTHFCVVDAVPLCEQCIPLHEARCKDRKHGILSRAQLLKTISAIRVELSTETKLLESVLGISEDGSRDSSLFQQRFDLVEQIKRTTELELDDNIDKLGDILNARGAQLFDANMEIQRRQTELLEHQKKRLGVAIDFYQRLIEMTSYLVENVSDVMSLDELEDLQNSVSFYSMLRFNSQAYSQGKISFSIDTENARERLNQVLVISDELEDDLVRGQRELESPESDENKWEIFRLCEHGAAPRDIGKGDFPYFFAVRVLETSENTVRVGFIDKDVMPPEEIGLGDLGTNSWAFDCPDNGSLKMTYQGRTQDVHLLRDQGQAPPAPAAWCKGTVIGCCVDRRRGRMFLTIQGPEDSVHTRTDEIKFECDHEFINPAICLESRGDRVRLEYARFIPDVSSIPF